jgi:hypothetical protein
VAERVRLNVIVRAMSATALAAVLASCVVREAQPRVSWDEVCSHIQDRQDLETCRTKVRELGSAPAAQPAAGGIPVRTSLPWSGVLSWWVIYYGFGVILARAVFVDARRRDWLVLQIRPIWWARCASSTRRSACWSTGWCTTPGWRRGSRARPSRPSVRGSPSAPNETADRRLAFAQNLYRSFTPWVRRSLSPTTYEFANVMMKEFAPHSRFRAAITPAGRGAGGNGARQDAEAPAVPKHVAMSWAQRLKRVIANIEEPELIAR